jgi:hypothetical protein
VRLPDRRGRQRRRLEPGEHGVGRRAELGGQQRLDAGRIGGRDVILEPGQLGDDIGREQVGPGREHLAELDEHAAGLVQRDPQVPGGRARFIGAGSPAAQVAAQPVPGGDPGDLQVPPGPAGALAQRPDRMGDRAGPQPALRRGEPARPGEQVERDRDQHRRDERPEQHARPGQRLRAAALAAERPGGHPAQDQAGESR